MMRMMMMMMMKQTHSDYRQAFAASSSAAASCPWAPHAAHLRSGGARVVSAKEIKGLEYQQLTIIKLLF